MKRRNFFKKLGCLIAGFAVIPTVLKATKNELSDYEKALRKETDKQAGHLAKIFITNPTFNDWTDDMPDGWIYHSPIESKERFELRKAINISITDEIVNRTLCKPANS